VALRLSCVLRSPSPPDVEWRATRPRVFAQRCGPADAVPVGNLPRLHAVPMVLCRD
jgi:hypothetical protein